jgi:exopolysaccharide biosynthesis polyprenyl glycosylphosphotransferase
LRFEVASLRPILYSLSFAEYLQILLAVSPAMIIVLALGGLYNLKGTRRFSSEFLKIILSVSAGLLLIVVLFFFNQQVFSSRLIVLFTWALTIVSIGLGRLILRAIQVVLLKKGIGRHRLVVIAPRDKTYGLVKKIEHRPELGYRILDKLDSHMDSEQLISRLEEYQRLHGIDELLQSDPHVDQETNLRILQFCRDYGIKFNFVPNLFETATTNIEVETISGIPLIVLKGTPLDGWGRAIKRALDVVISFFALILLSPVFLITAIAIRLNSRGPVFFHQPRAAGLGQFECYKFRSMYYEMSEGTASGDKLRAEIEKQNARGNGPFVKIKNDPRVTPVGRFIRRTKIDELPQLWHILRGQMSLVGPRVHMVKEVDHFRAQYKRVFIIKPGATGLTQITQATDKPEISFEEEIQLDSFYIENWSLWLDLYIIFKTVLILLGRKPKVDY